MDVFFVISGFIIPYSMARCRYDLRRDFGRFIAKRIIRLDPPYFVAALATLGLWYVSALVPGFRGVAPHATTAQILAHVGYLNDLLNLPWLNPVFWSLAIEFQFYLLIAVVFPVLSHSTTWIRAAGLAAVWGGAMLSPSPTLVFHNLGLFGCGLACFQFYEGHLGRTGFVAVVVAMALPTYVNGSALSSAVTIATALVIAWGQGGSALGSWFGKISYSLYLVHVPVGGRLVNLGTRFAHSTLLQVMVLALAMAGSIAAAVMLHRFVESRAQRWSAAVRYRNKEPEALRFRLAAQTPGV